MNIYIAHTSLSVANKKELFILTRPFYNENEWVDDFNLNEEVDSSLKRVHSIAEADVVFLPFSINYYVENKLQYEVESINNECEKHSKIAYTYLGGDFGIKLSEYSNVIYFRMGGFRSQLSKQNLGFPVPLSDHFQRLFKQKTITPSSKKDLPIVGFCGHATFSNLKRLKEIVKCVIENIRRFFQNPFRKDWETLFASAFERATLLRYFEKSPFIKTNVIYRQHYRGGAQTDSQREQTTLEYYSNIATSDYILCLRGAGNFSVRFYETLMMGKIPIFVNTDCLLPFEDKINWKQHVVWVEWKERENIAQIVSDFHQKINNDDFKQMQLNNRRLWKEQLSVKGMYNFI